ncbi:MAG: hypothetical protein EAY75_15435 [Bacteroidetes bacterium]|nr:MAG: hypothetical protein EAY75_15435 [Bacteroidota bacterium]
MQPTTIKWLLQSTLGLVLTGAGLCMCIDAGVQKQLHAPWIAYGTLALSVFNAGLCIVIDAGIRKAKNS